MYKHGIQVSHVCQVVEVTSIPSVEGIRVQYASTTIPDMSGIVVQIICSLVKDIENNAYFQCL